jgi:branched-chain amino acid transport system permease protein
VLAASYDLLLGYTGIVSFAHTMFYGIGGYGVGLSLYNLDPTVAHDPARPRHRPGRGRRRWRLLIGLLSLRVKAIFFAMITLAVASAFALLASQLSWFTGGEDGRSFRVPEILRPGYRLFEQPILGVTINGRIITYYLIFAVAGGAVPHRAAHRQLAVRPRAAGDPREPDARRGARLSRRLLPHRGQLPRGRRWRSRRAA